MESPNPAAAGALCWPQAAFRFVGLLRRLGFVAALGESPS